MGLGRLGNKMPLQVARGEGRGGDERGFEDGQAVVQIKEKFDEGDG